MNQLLLEVGVLRTSACGHAFLIQPAGAIDLGTKPIEQVAVFAANADGGFVVQLDLRYQQTRIPLRAAFIVRDPASCDPHRLSRARGSQVGQTGCGVAAEDLHGFRPRCWRNLIRTAPIVSIQDRHRFTTNRNRQRKRCLSGRLTGKRWRLESWFPRAHDYFATFHRLCEESGTRRRDSVCADLCREPDGFVALQMIAVTDEDRGA
jgi:hypothetical protein